MSAVVLITIGLLVLLGLQKWHMHYQADADARIGREGENNAN